MKKKAAEVLESQKTTTSTMQTAVVDTVAQSQTALQRNQHAEDLRAQDQMFMRRQSVHHQEKPAAHHSTKRAAKKQNVSKAHTVNK